MIEAPGWEEAFDSLYQSYKNDEICGWEIALAEKRVVKEIKRLRDTIERQQAVIEAVEEVDRVSRNLEDSIPLSLSIALGDMLARLDALRTLDGPCKTCGDKKGWWSDGGKGFDSCPDCGGGDDERKYPCDKCGKLRSKAEGGTIFTVCDECWDKHYGGGDE